MISHSKYGIRSGYQRFSVSLSGNNCNLRGSVVTTEGPVVTTERRIRKDLLWNCFGPAKLVPPSADMDWSGIKPQTTISMPPLVHPLVTREEIARVSLFPAIPRKVFSFRFCEPFSCLIVLIFLSYQISTLWHFWVRKRQAFLHCLEEEEVLSSHQLDKTVKIVVIHFTSWQRSGQSDEALCGCVVA